MILLDVTHTSHTRSQSGVQQVCRNLYASLSDVTEVVPIVYDPYQEQWRPTDRSELGLLKLDPVRDGSRKRSARWGLAQKARGMLKRLVAPRAFADFENAEAILVPEIIDRKRPLAAYKQLRKKTQAPLCAVFHDAIALKLPQISPKKTVSYFPKYLNKLKEFDAIASVSRASMNDMQTYWAQHGWKNVPPLTTIALGTQLQQRAPVPSNTADELPMVLFVGSIEGRKNHLELLKAAENLWQRGLQFRLEFIGGAVEETAGAALTQIATLADRGHPIIWHGPVDAATLDAAYQRCYFTTYPSFLEGFGLPVLESLSFGKPSLCSNRGGLAESIEGGGCLVLDDLTANGIAQGLEKLLTDQALYDTLKSEAKSRTFRSWKDYAADIIAWSKTVSLR